MIQRASVFSVAFVATGAAAALVSATRALWGHLPMLPFLAAIVATSAYGGVGPGLGATVLGTVATAWFTDQTLATPAGVVGLVVFALLGALIAVAQERVQRAARAREHALRALADTDARCNKLTETVPGILFAADAGGRWEYVSARFYELTGAPSGTGEGEGWTNALHPEDRGVVLDHWQQAIARGEAFESEYRLRLGDGSHRWFRTRAIPTQVADGRVTGWFGVAMDIDEQVRARDSLRQTASEYEAAFTLATVAMAQSDPDTGRFLRVNRRMCDMTGYSAEELLGMTYLDVTHPADREWNLAFVRRVLAGESPEMTLEKRYRRKDGATIWVHLSAAVVRDADGRPLHCVSAIRDITPRRHAETHRERLLRQQTAILDAASSGIFGVDVDGRCTFINQAAVDMFGRAREDVLGRHLHELVHHTRADGSPYPREQCPAYAAARHGETAHVDEDIAWRRDGTSFPIEYACAPVVVDGRVEGAVISVTDVTARRVVERERTELLGRERAARAEAETANRAKDEFIAMVSHELRAPLSAIRMWTSLLRSDRLPPEKSQHGLEVIERSVATQARLIDDLLDVSRIVSGKLVLSRRPVDVREPVQAAVDAFRPAASARGIRLADALPAQPVHVSGDPARLQQIVSNLLSNAVKFTSGGGAVAVTLDAADGAARLTVRDTGRGIPEEMLPHVFERYRQVEESSRGSGGGLGLGLAIVRQLVVQHGGHVEATSGGRGHGATFTVTLPLTTDTPEVAATAPARTDAGLDCDGLLDGVRVLVVEDDADARESIVVTLEGCGAETHAADSVSAALELLHEVHPDVVLSDIAMPGGDGYALMRRLRADRSAVDAAIPAIALTAYASARDRQRILAAGFQAHLAKPADPNALVETVASVARTRRGTSAGPPERTLPS